MLTGIVKNITLVQFFIDGLLNTAKHMNLLQNNLTPAPFIHLFKETFSNDEKLFGGVVSQSLD